MTVLYTIGHSNREQPRLLAILKQAGIAALVDVRARPQSGRFPQFNEDNLRRALEDAGIVYRWAGGQLGGMRAPQPDSRHLALQEGGMRAYADYMQTGDFRRAAAGLIEMAARTPLAIMCAERDPAHCHRSLISDYLTLQGVKVIHLVEAGEIHEHVLRPEVRRASAELIYDRHAQGELGL